MGEPETPKPDGLDIQVEYGRLGDLIITVDGINVALPAIRTVP